MSKRVAVTGAAGFIGSNLCAALVREGIDVVGIDNLSSGWKENVPEGIDFRVDDILNPSMNQYFSGCETVFHLAAKNCLPDCAADPVETARVNVQGTANVMAAAVAASVAHVVYADTSAEYEGLHQFPSHVDKVKPMSVYACSKRGGALMAEACAQLHGIKVSFVRYFNVYGPAQDYRRNVPPVMSAFVLRLLRGEAPIIYGTGKKSRDFIHVDDVNSFHVRLLRDPSLRGGTYNLGSGRDHTVLEILDLVQSIMGKRIVPQFREELPMEAERTLADISQTLATGWSPRVSLEAGLEAFILQMKKGLVP